MKTLLVSFTILFSIFSFGANRFWVSTVSSNWNNIANWSTTSGGLGGASVPGATDVAIFDANGLGSCDLDITSTISGLTLNGYTAILDLDGNTLTVSSGNTTLTTGTINDTPNTTSLTINSTGTTIFNGTTFGAEVNCNSGRLFLNGSVFNNGAFLTKTGGSNDVGQGGNTFNLGATLDNTGSGYLLCGNNNPDVFNGSVLLNNSSTSLIYIAHNSAGNIINGDLTCNNSGSGTGIRLAGNTAGALTVNGNVTMNLTGSANNSCRVGDNGDVIITGTFDYINNSTATQTNFYMATGTNSSVRIDGVTTITNAGTGATTQRAYIGENGDITFNGDLNITNSSSATNSEIYLNRSTNSTNIYNENISIESTIAGCDGVRFGEGAGTGTLATNKTISIGAGGFISGILNLRNFMQTGTTPQNLSLTSAGIMIIYDANFGGNVDFISPRITTRGTTYQGTANITKNGASTDNSVGGNTFSGNTSITNSGTGELSMGNGSPDTFGANVSMINSGTSNLRLANNSAGNTIAGNLIILNDGNANNVYLSSATASTLAISGNLSVTDNSSDTDHDHYIGDNGDITLSGDLTLVNNAIGDRCDIIVANNTNAQVSVGGNTNATNNGAGATISRVWFGINGDCVLNNLTINNLTGSANSGVYLNHNANSTNTYNGNIVLVANNAVSDGIRFGEGGGSGTLAAGQTVSIGPGGFIAGDLRFRNFTQLGTIPQSISCTGTARIYNYDSNWGGNVDFDAPRILTRGTTYNGTADLEKTEGISDDQSVGGNFFIGNAVLRNSGSNYLMMGNGTADDYQSNLDIINNGTDEIYIAHNSAGNTIGGDLTINMSGSALRVEFCDNANSTMTVSGNTTINNSSTAATNQLLFGDNGDIDFDGFVNITTTSGGVNSYVYFANNTNSQVSVDGAFTFTHTTSATNNTRSYLGNQGDMIFNQTLTIINSSPATNSEIYCNHNVNSMNSYNHNIILEETVAGGDGILFGNATGSGTLAATRTVSIGPGGFVSGDLRFRNFTQIGSTAQTIATTGTSRIESYDANWGGDIDFTAPRILTRGTTYNLTSSIEKTAGIGDDASAGGNTFAGNCVLTNSGGNYFMMGNGNPDNWQANLTVINNGTDDFYLAHNSTGNSISGVLDVTMSNTADRVELCDNTNSSLTVTGAATITNSSSSTNNAIMIGENGDIDFENSLLIDNNGGGTTNRVQMARGTNSNISIDGFFTFNHNATATNDSRAYIGENGDIIFNGVVTINNASDANNSQIYCNQTGNSSNVYNNNIILTCTAPTSDGIRFGESNGTGVLAATRTVTIGGGGFISGDLQFRNFTQIGPTAQALSCTGNARVYNYDSNWGGNIEFIAPRMLTRGTTYSGTSYLEKTGAGNDDSFGGNTFVGNAQLVNSGSSQINFGNGLADTWQLNLEVDNTGTSRIIIASNSAGNTIAGTLNWRNSSTGNQADVICNSTGSNLTVTGAAAFENTGSAGADIYVGNSGNVVFNSTLNLTQNTTGISGAVFYMANGASSSVSVAGNVDMNNIGASTSSDIYIGNSGDVNFLGNLTAVNAGSATNSRLFIASGTTSQFIIDGTTTIENNSIATSDSRMYLGNNGDVTFNGPLNLSNNSGSNSSQIYCNHTVNSTGQYNDNIIVESTNANSDGIRFGESNGNGTLAATQTISIGVGGFISGDLQFRNFTQVGPTDHTLTCTGTARIYNYDSNWGGNVTFTAPRMNTRGTTYDQTSYLEKTGTSDDASTGGNLFVGDCQLVNSGSRYFLMGNGIADVWQSNLNVLNSGSDDMFIAHNSSGNTVAGVLDWINSGSGVNNYISNATASDLIVSGSATFLNTSVASSNIYIGNNGDITFNSTLDATNTTSGSINGNVRIAEGTSSMVTIAGATNLTNNGTSTSSSLVVGNNGDADFNSTLNMINAGSGTNSYFYLGNSANSVINVAGNATLSQSGGIINSRSYLGNSSTNTYNGDLTITNSASSTNSEVYLNRTTSAVANYNGNISVTSENASCDGVRFGQDGGTATLATGQTVSIGASGFVAGDLRFRNFTQNGGTAQTLLCTGTARIYQDNSIWNAATMFSAPRYYTRNTTYNTNTEISKTGASSDDSSGGNSFNGNTIITNSGTGRLRWSTTSGTPDDFNGNVTFIKNSTGFIQPSYNNTDTYFGDINIDANSQIYFGQAGNGRVLLDGTAGDQNINDLGTSTTPLFRDFQVDKSIGDVNLNMPIEIVVELDLDNGVVNSSPTNLVYMRDNSSVSSVSDASHIDGPVEKIGNDAFVFPVGDSSIYRPIAMSNPGSGSARFRAEYINDDPDPTYDDNSKDLTINHISSCEYWTLDRIATTNNVVVTLSWDTPASCGVDNLPELTVARWDGTVWRDEGNGGTTGNVTTGTISSSGTVTNFSPFTLASTTFNNPLPIELLEFTAVLDRDEVTLNWTTLSETDNDYFDIEKSADGINWELIERMDGAGNSSQEINYETIDKTPFLGVNYYRLKQVDFDGDFMYSEVRTVNYELSDGNDLIIYPNPTQNVVYVTGGNEALIAIEVYDAFGKRLPVSVDINNSKAIINLENYESGVYFIKTPYSVNKVIKQ